MDYKEELKSVTNFEQLFELREKLLNEVEVLTQVDALDTDWKRITKCQNANFWLDRVVLRIKYLEKTGEHLDKIEGAKSVD